ncbi:MAG: DNA helicase PcrA [Eubacteriales bacterium]|nr:DNA helicase PcrA [Eubacteriales bacterium]
MDFSQLNPMQRAAAQSVQGPLLILAGAGSGKTKTLISRIANILEQGLARPEEILAITFTNKAAAEMRQRVTALVGDQAQRMQLSTFHSFCVRLLRNHISELGYTRWFSIYDDDDSMSVIKAVIAEMNLNDKQCPPRAVRSRISDAKNRLLTADELLKDSDDPRDGVVCEIFKRYDAKLRASNALDFDDLLLKTLELFTERPQILSFYQQRFRYIHVDEYQDTNKAQYMLVQLLAAYYRNICVVGDDDQSIYGWRGADIRNILDFEKDFPDAKVIRLEQNYRSTDQILAAANAVIANNTARKEKKLWTERTGGEKVCVYQANNEKDEAQFCLRTIASLKGDYSYSDFAILYRTNAQARAVEDSLVLTGVPYSVYGGMRFYDRKEIKDVVSYLRVLANPADSAALQRIVNVPKRGIGASTMAKLAGVADAQGRTLWEVLCDHETVKENAPRAASAMGVFTETMKRLMDSAEGMGLVDFLDQVLTDTGYESMYQNAGDEDAAERVENLKEFRSAAAEFAESNEGAALGDFLENIALVSDVDKLEDDSGKVTLMTLHSAKGLEFPVVFIIGMEDGIFPSSRSMDDMDRLEEERRLCYVGITRAMKKLYLVHAHQRLIYGEIRTYPPSRFLTEIPVECEERAGELERRESFGAAQGRVFAEGSAFGGGRAFSSKKRPPATTFKPGFVAAPKPAVAQQPLNAGDKVSHSKFGRGTIIKIDQRGDKKFYTIAFEGMGIKELLASVAPLEKL